MTALDFISAGVVFARARARLVVRAPRNREDLVEQLRAEVARRVPYLRDERIVRNTAAPRGVCETCGDPMRTYLAGMCELCAAARAKALVQLGRITA